MGRSNLIAGFKPAIPCSRFERCHGIESRPAGGTSRAVTSATFCAATQAGKEAA